MSIDLVLWGQTRADFVTFAVANGLLIEDAEGNRTQREGFTFSWWNGSGNLMTAPGTYDELGVELTPPTFAPGQFTLLRIYGDFFNQDHIDDPVDDEAWSRSKVARYIKNNGTPGSIVGLPYYQFDGIRVFTYEAVQQEVLSRGAPGHMWL